MELIFFDELDISVDNRTQFLLPAYINKLPEDEFEQAVAAEDAQHRIIAAGTDPKDGKITMLTAAGKVMIFDARKFHIPDGDSKPCHAGYKLHLPNEKNRWPGMEDGCFVDVQWVLQNSVSGLVGATISTNTYPNEDKR